MMSYYDNQRYLGENEMISRDKIFECQCCQFQTRKKNVSTSKHKQEDMDTTSRPVYLFYSM